MVDSDTKAATKNMSRRVIGTKGWCAERKWAPLARSMTMSSHELVSKLWK